MLDIEITSHCNQRCRYCFVRELRKGRHMDPETIRSILFEGSGAGFDTVHLTGGEPLVHPGFEEIIESIADFSYSRIIINTNGTLLTEDIARKLAGIRVPVALTISLDGFETQHEENRGTYTYKKTIRGLETALRHGLSTTVFTVASASNMRTLPSFLAWLWESFPAMDGVSLIPLGDVSAAWKETQTAGRPGMNRGESGPRDPGDLTPQDILELGCISAASIIRGRRVAVLDYPLMNLVYKALDIPLSMFGSHCTACRGRICIQADGTITPCHPCWAPLGTYRPGVLMDVLDSRVFNDIKNKRFDGCDVCEDREICGGCRASAFGKSGNLLARDSSCRVVRSALKSHGSELEPRVEALINFFSTYARGEQPLDQSGRSSLAHNNVNCRESEERRPSDVVL